MSTRRLIAVLVAFYALLVFNANAAQEPAPVPVMKSEITITGEVVHLGDLLDHAGSAASAAVFHAPALGTSGTVQTHRVIEVARQNGLPYFDTRGLNEITIFRASRTINVGELEQSVSEAAAKHLNAAKPEDITVRFDRDVRALHVEPSAVASVRIAQFAFDPITGRFEGIVEVAGSLSLKKRPVRVTGILQETTEIVVLARAIGRGETVRESDILIERQPRSEVASDAVVKTGAAVGQAARRALRAGQTLRPADLMKPDFVTRNDMVTILFEVPGITLTSRGKALASGAEGETVSVLNLQSKRVLHTTVRAPGVVVVSRGASVTADATGAAR